jgi:hypothetical protein
VEVEAISSTLNISFSGTRIAYYSEEKTLIIYDTNVTFRLQKINMKFTGRLYLLKLNASDGFLNGLKSMTCFGEFNAMFGNSTRMFPMVQFGMTLASGKNTSTYALRLSEFDEFAEGLFDYIRDKTGANIPNFGIDFVVNLAKNFKAFTFYIADGKINWKKLTFKKATQLPALENNETSEDKNATLGNGGQETMIKGFANKFYAYLKENKVDIMKLVARAFCSAADKALESASPPNGTQNWMDKHPAAKPMVKSAVAICNMITALLHGETAKICIGSESECGLSPVNYTNATNRTASFVIEQSGSYNRTKTGRRLEANYTIVEPSVVSIGIIARAITGDSFFGNDTNVSSSSPTLDAIKFANVSMGVLIDANKTTNLTRFKLDMAAEPMLQNVAFLDVVRPYMGTLKDANVGVEVLTQKKSNGTGRMKWGFGFNVGARFTAPDGSVDAGTPVVQLMGRGSSSSCDSERGISFHIEKKAALDSTFALKNFHVDVDACIRFYIRKLPFQQNSSTCDSSYVDLFGYYIPKSKGSTYKGFRADSHLNCIPLAGKSWNGDVGLVALWGDRAPNISKTNYSIGFSGNVSSDSNLGATLFFAFKEKTWKRSMRLAFNLAIQVAITA